MDNLAAKVNALEKPSCSTFSICDQLSVEVVPLPSPGRELSFKSANKRPSVLESNVEKKKKKKQKRRNQKRRKFSSKPGDVCDRLHAIDAKVLDLEARIRKDPQFREERQNSAMLALNRLTNIYLRDDYSNDGVFDSPG